MSIGQTEIRPLYPKMEKISLAELEDTIHRLKNKFALLNLSIAEILDSLDFVSRELLNRDSSLAKIYGTDIVSYISSFLSRQNLFELIQIQKIDPKSYDEFVKVSPRKSIRRMPKGIVSQWIAGNVPLLGIMTLALSMIAKNINVIRLSSRQNDYLNPFLDLLARNGTVGKILAENVMVVSYDSEDKEASGWQSRISDCRLVFGGQEAVEEIVQLTHSWHVEDIVLGPRTSFGVIDPASLSSGALTRLASDILVFDQLACSSPQFIFVKQNGNTEDFAKELYKSMRLLLPCFPRHPLSHSETFDICEARTRLVLKGAKIFCLGGTRLTVSLFSSLEKDSICGNGLIQLITFNDFEEIYKHIPSNVQTVVTCLSKYDFNKFTAEASRYGVCRFPIIGESNFFEVPWDGIEVLSRLSRTVIRTDP